MTTMEILNLIAIIIILILAVLIGQFLQNKVSIRKERVEIFKKLMTYRNIGYTDMTAVEALNQIPILFVNNKTVMKEYNNFIELMNSKKKDEDSSDKIEKSKKKLLETMARSLHYKRINWEIIETPYLPPETMENRSKGEKLANDMVGMFSTINQFLNDENKGKFEESLDLSLIAQKMEIEKNKKKGSKKKIDI